MITFFGLEAIPRSSASFTALEIPIAKTVTFMACSFLASAIVKEVIIDLPSVTTITKGNASGLLPFVTLNISVRAIAKAVWVKVRDGWE